MELLEQSENIMDEWTRVLNGFIDENLQEDEAPETAATFSYGGVNYRLSEDEAEPTFGIDRLTLAMNGYSFTQGKENALLFADKRPLQELKITCVGSDWEKLDDEGQYVTAVLYRVGVPEPIAETCGRFSDGVDINLTLSLKMSMADCGKYLLFFPYAFEAGSADLFHTVKSGVFTIFNLLPDGATVKRPCLLEAEASVCDADRGEGGVCLSQRIGLTTLLGDTGGYKQELSALCYDERRSLMARSDKVVTAKRCRQAGRFLFQLDTEKLWLEGKYEVVLCLNRHPFGRIAMEIGADAEIKCRVEELDKNSALYWMVARMEYGRLQGWQVIREFGDLGREKDKLVALHREFMELHRTGGRQSGEWVFIGGDTRFHAERVAVAGRDIFKIGKKSLDIIDCTKTDEEGNPSRERFLRDRTDRTFVLRKIHGLLRPEAKPLLQALLDCAACPTEHCRIVLCGSEDNWDTLLKLTPALTDVSLSERSIHAAGYVPRDMLWQLMRFVVSSCGGITSAAMAKMYAQVCRCWDVYGLAAWRESEMQCWVDQCIKTNLEVRVALKCDAEHFDLEHYLMEHPLIDGTCAVDGGKEGEAFSQAMQALDAMIGLGTLKENLKTTFRRVRFNRQREQMGLPADMAAPQHMIFTGNPGTGKTTVAKLMGKIYKSMGLLSNGEVCVTERSQLVGAYIGQTEENMRNLIADAKGKVLFIDEAYTLTDSAGDRKDFGNHVIESLLTLLAEPHNDLLVILAGYEAEMENLLDRNRGLRSRFAYKFSFEDYTAEELMQIVRLEMDKYKYKLTPDAECCLRETIHRAVVGKDKDFGNGRWVLQLLNNGILPAMANRVMASKEARTLDLFMTITKEDVEKAAASYLNMVVQPKKRIGFVI